MMKIIAAREPGAPAFAGAGNCSVLETGSSKFVMRVRF
jgi:hypothetical protein